MAGSSAGHKAGVPMAILQLPHVDYVLSLNIYPSHHKSIGLFSGLTSLTMQCVYIIVVRTSL